jgi:hypothetical protein
MTDSARPSVEYVSQPWGAGMKPRGLLRLAAGELEVLGAPALGAQVAFLASRGLDDIKSRQARLEAGGQVGYYVVFLLPTGQMEYCHTEGPPIEHFGHVAALAGSLAQRMRVPKVVILSWRELDAAPLVAPVGVPLNGGRR